MRSVHYEGGEGSFRTEVPEGWEEETDPDGGLLLAREEGVGLLHLLPFERGPEEALDPAEELYAFLDAQDIQLEEDEVEDIELPEGGALALCEYLAEDGEELTYCLVAVATAAGRLLFASYTCPAGEEEKEAEEVRAILGRVTLS